MENVNKEEVRLLDLPTMMNPRDLFSFNFIIQDSGPCLAYFPHYHDYYEISFYYGKKPVAYRVGDEEYSASYGDIVLCDMFEPHMFLMRNNDYHEHLTLGVNASMLISLSNGECNLIDIFDRDKRSHPILHVNTVKFSKYLDVIKILYENDAKHSAPLLERALAIQLLTYIYEDTYDDRKESGMNIKTAAIVSQIKQYVDSHINTPITLNGLAEETNYSVGYLCRVFKSVANKTLVQYINEKRIEKAKDLLSGSLSIAEIALETGYESYTYFYRVFKKHTGMGPEEYRRKMTK